MNPLMGRDKIKMLNILLMTLPGFSAPLPQSRDWDICNVVEFSKL